MGDRRNSGPDRTPRRSFAGACLFGAGLAFSAPALAGGDSAAADKGGVALSRAGEPAISVLPRGSDEIVYVISGEGTNVYSLRDYLAAQASGIKLTGIRATSAPPETPQATVVEAVPAVADEPAMPVSPPRPVAQSAPPPSAAPLQTAAAEPTDDGLAGILSEIRIGGMAHDVGVFGTNKEDGFDVNAELLFVSPDFLEIIFSPRPHVGITANTAGHTSQVYGGLAWDWTFWDPFFVEGTLAIAVHNGETSTRALDEKSLGCHVLFRESASLGARFLERHSLSVMLAHISDANLCDNNEGLDTLGVRYGYKF